MILPRSGSNQIVSIKTNNIYLTIKRRKETSLASDALKQQKSKLEIWGNIIDLKVEDEIIDSLDNNTDYIKIETAPLFFEQSDYLINAKTLNGCPLYFDHANKGIREAISVSFDDRSMLSGTINFGSEVGYSNLIFFDDQGNRLLLEIEVFPSKLSYKEDYEAIRNDINEMVEAATIDFLKSTFTNVNTTNLRNNVPAVFFELINQLFEKYYKSINVIMLNPNHKLVTEHVVLPAHKIKKNDVKTYQWIAKHSDKVKRVDGSIRVNSALTVKKRIIYDTFENRLVKFMLSSTVERLLDFKRKYLSNFRDSQKSADIKVLNRIDSMVSKVKIILKNPVFADVSSLKNLETMSLVFQMAPGYREMYKCYQLMHRSISFNGEVFNLSLKDTATLYEYWCFIKLVNIMKNNQDYTLIDDGKDIIKANRKGITVTLSKDSKSIVRFIDTKTGDKIKIIYNPGAYSTETVKQIPDNVLSLEKNVGFGNESEIYQYIFDAKYKVEMNPDEYYPDENPGPKVVDINTMHRYRDAIVTNMNNMPKKIMFGAYVLFPYPRDEDEYKKHQFFKSIDKVNIGGIPFLPSKTQIAEDILARLISESNNSAFERSILPVGIESRLAKVEWDKKDVLIGSLSSKKQFDAVIKDKYYYIPKSSMPDIRKNVRYIALYQSNRLFGKNSGILYYGEVLSSEIRKRKNINNISGRTNPNEDCFYYSIDEWKTLDSKIEFEEEWVYKPRLTNYFLLNNSIKTFELFNIRTEEDYRLVTELRRLQKNIDVKDTVKDLFIKFNDSISFYNDDEYIYVYQNGVTKIRKSTKTFSEHPSEFFWQIRYLLNSSSERDAEITV